MYLTCILMYLIVIRTDIIKRNFSIFIDFKVIYVHCVVLVLLGSSSFAICLLGLVFDLDTSSWRSRSSLSADWCRISSVVSLHPPGTAGTQRGDFEIEYDNEWDDDWADRHPADDPDDLLQPVVMLDRISVDSVSCAGSNEDSQDMYRRPGPASAVRPYRCQHCQARFAAKKSLQQHLRLHFNEKPFACAYCSRRFSQRSAWVIHERAHSVEAPFSCEPCGRRFRFSKALSTHLRDAHGCARPLKCAVCEALFVSSGALQQHEERQHGIVPPPAPPAPPSAPPSKPKQPPLSKSTVCCVCDKNFPTHTAMLTHLRVHGEGSRFRCRLCPAHFSSFLSLRSHVRVHSRGSVFKCKQCPMRFGARSSLFSHIKQHDRMKGKKLFRCSKCMEGFVCRKALYAHHVEIHREVDQVNQVKQVEPESPEPSHAKEDGKLYYCETCPDTFDKYWNFWNHRKNLCTGLHGKPVVPTPAKSSPGKGFCCGTCGLSFKTRKKLYWHSQSHFIKPEPETEIAQAADAPAEEHPNEEVTASPSPQKTFRCGKCSQPFPDRRALHVHSKTHSGAMVVIGVEDDTVMQLDPASLLEPSAHDVEAGIAPAPVSTKKGKASKNIFRCGQCGKSYRGRKLLWHHRKTCFPDDKKGLTAHLSDAAPDPNDSVIKVEPTVKPKKYRCTKCPEVFSDVDKHWLHYKVHVEDDTHEVVHEDVAADPLASSSYKCRDCDLVFPHRIGLWWHYKSHLGGEEVEDTCVSSPADPAAGADPLSSSLRCRECPEVFADEDLHWQHYRVHVSEPCEEVRPEEAEDTPGGPEPSYQCKRCPEAFPDERSHWMHFKIHTELPDSELYEVVKPANGLREGMPGQYRCSSCLELFEDLESHWWHFRAHYPPEELAQLENLVLSGAWGGEAESSASLRYKCSQCPELFEDERSRWTHYRVHAADASSCFEIVPSPPEYRCVTCSQVFPDIPTHWLHYRSHYKADVFDLMKNGHVNGEAERSPAEKQYRCSKCPELFQDQDAHWEHFRQHYQAAEDRPCQEVEVDKDTDEKMTGYRCGKCEQMSDDLEAHWWHYRSHMDVSADVELDQSDTVTFRCLECSETFPDADSHWVHYRQHVDAEVCEEVVQQDVKPKLYPCSKCPEVFPDRRSRFLHCAVHVTPRGAGPGPSAAVLMNKSMGLQCRACSEIFLDSESHWWHYKTVHKPDAEQVGPETYQIVELTADPTEDPMTKRCQCSKCPETFQDRKAHRRHWKAVHAIETYASPSVAGGFPCSKCSEVFADRKSHWWHYRVHTDAFESTTVEVAAAPPELPAAEEQQSGVFSCSHCAELFADREDLQKHLGVEHSDVAKEEAARPKEYRCARCAEVFPDLEQHWWHYRVHSEEEFVVSVKGLVVEKPAEPRAETTPARFRFQCSKCPESFPDRKAHWVHYKNHKIQSSTTYVSTPEPSKSAQEVKQTKTYKCNQCSKVFQLWINLFNHKKTHDLAARAAQKQNSETGPVANSSIPAEVIPAVASKASSSPRPSSGRDLSSSVVVGRGLCLPSVVAGRSFKCSKCPARLSSRRVLWAHFKTHKQSGRMYPCADCDAKFNSRGALRTHAQVHRAPGELEPLPPQDPLAPPKPLQEESFACSKCDAVFKSKISLGSHQRVHPPAVKPFKCQQCGKRFTLGFNMLRHMKTAHLKGNR